MWAIPALILLAIAPGGEAKPLVDQASGAEPLVLRLAAPEEAPTPPAPSTEATRLAAATTTARRGTPRVSKVRCAPTVCTSNCPVVKAGGGDAAPDEASPAPLHLARTSAPESSCAHAAKAGADDSSR